MGEIAKLEAREVARDAMFSYIELGPDSLWELMRQANVSELERRTYFSKRAAAMTEAGRTPDYPKKYAEVVEEAAKARKPSTAPRKTAAQLLDEAER